MKSFNTRLLLRGAIAIGALVVATGIANADPDIAAARAFVEKYRKLPEFSAPDTAFDAHACAAGKKVMVIPVSSANPSNKNIIQSMETVGASIGVEVTEWENQASPTQWAQGMDHARNNGFNAVVLLGGVDPALLGPQIKAAKDAGLIVTTAHLEDLTQNGTPELDLSQRLDFQKVGEILADWVIAQTDGKPNVLLVGSDEIVPNPAYRAKFEEVMKACGPNCKTTYINAPVPEWSTKIQPSVQSALISDPTINYVVPMYDSMSQFIMPAITITGKTGQVKIATFNGTPFVLDEVRNGNVEMNIGESIGWIARSVLDGTMRKMCGMSAKNELYVPFYLFDKDNVESAGVPAEFDKGFGDAYIKGYNKLWGLE